MGDLARLASLNVADNSLSGPIPGSLHRFSAENFAGNDGLCGAPLGKCKRQFHVRIRVRPVRMHLRLRRVNDASRIGGAVGFVVGFGGFLLPAMGRLQKIEAPEAKCKLRPQIYKICVANKINIYILLKSIIICFVFLKWSLQLYLHI
jgi:hypothetical protein